MTLRTSSSNWWHHHCHHLMSFLHKVAQRSGRNSCCQVHRMLWAGQKRIVWFLRCPNESHCNTDMHVLYIKRYLKDMWLRDVIMHVAPSFVSMECLPQRQRPPWLHVDEPLTARVRWVRLRIQRRTNDALRWRYIRFPAYRPHFTRLLCEIASFTWHCS